MTSRQLALMQGGLPEDALMSLPMSEKAMGKDRPLTEEQQVKKQEALLRRKIVQEQRDEEAKKQTISKLLQKKDVKEAASLKSLKAHVSLKKTTHSDAKHSLIRYVCRHEPKPQSGASAASSTAPSSLTVMVAFPIGDRSLHDLSTHVNEYVLRNIGSGCTALY